MPRPEDIASLAARAATGDREALGSLWRAEHPGLLRYLRVRVGDALAEDVASSVWIDVARGLAGFSGGRDDFRRWLFTIGRRRAIDELRRRGRRPEELHGVDPERPAGGSAEPGGGPEDLEAALHLVRLLTPDQAEAVLLRVVADLDVAATAALMGRSEMAVRALTHRGLHRLAELVARPSPTSGNPGRGVTPTTRAAMERSR
ncbi:MAG: sigma-70 family RNA polymerase sigma factor [Acidimicrobiales bacterium]|nr:sigma-70 family RNA polymerase sigma factor [Acidimicrobiales bacterium]